jgi:hypothetical protein
LGARADGRDLIWRILLWIGWIWFVVWKLKTWDF